MRTMKISKKISILIIFCISLSTVAGDLLLSQIRKGETSDKIDFEEVSIGATYNEKDLFWPYLNEASEPLAFGVTYYHRNQKGRSFESTYQEAKAKIQYFHNKEHKISVLPGFYVIDEIGYADKRVKGALDLLLESIWLEEVSTSFSFGSGSAVKEIFQTGSDLKEFDQTFFKSEIKYSFFEKNITARIQYRKNNLENDISRDFFDGQLMYSLMKYPHWIRVGLGYHTLEFNKTSSKLWTPLEFYSYGPRLDLSYLFTKELSAFLGGSYSWFEENKTFSGSGYYLRAGLKYGLREDFTIQGTFERNESVQNNNKWDSDSFVLNLNYFL